MNSNQQNTNMDKNIAWILIICAVFMKPSASLAQRALRKPSLPVSDLSLHLNLLDDSKDYQVNSLCHTVMCGILVSDLKDLEDFDIRLLVSENMCTQLVFRDKIVDGQVGRNIAQDANLVQQILFIRKKHPHQEVIINIQDPDKDFLGFESYLYKSTKQQKLTTSVSSFMRTYNFTGLQLRLKFKTSSNSRRYQKSLHNMIRFVKMFSDFCQLNNWTFDIEFRSPYEHTIKDNLLGVLQNHSRFLILSLIKGKSVVSHNFPLYGKEDSLETMANLIYRSELNKDNVVIQIPFYGEIFVPKINSTWNTNDTELVGCQGDSLNDRVDLPGSGVTTFSDICEYLFDNDGNWTLFNDPEAHSMFVYNENQWVTTETTSTLMEKVEYLISQGITRFALLDVHDDDYDGKECKVTFPLLKTVLKVVTSSSNCTGMNYSSVSTSSGPETNYPDHINENSYWSVLVNTGSIRFIALLIIGGGMMYLINFCLNRKTGAKNVQRNRKSETNEVQIIISEEVAELEIPPDEFQIYPVTVVGKGQFNIVLKGSILNDDVAVKIPKRNANSKQSIEHQLSEIETLKLLNGHKNIIGLLGVCTKLMAKGCIYVFLEFCPLGSLDKYLKAHRENFISLIQDDEFYIPSKRIQLEKKLSTDENIYEPFNTKTLISWAHQVCDGMEYISEKNVVHGDLAARNLLMQSLENIKICDFGMSRKSNSLETLVLDEKSQIACKDAIPWRWLPYETLETGMMSLKSDVWSYGVTLWEIFSLGEVPYAGLEWNSDFLQKLKDGLRLQSPRYSTSEMYKSFILPCWEMNYEDRPSFLTIKANISHCIQSIFSNGYEEVEHSGKAKTNEAEEVEIEILE